MLIELIIPLSYFKKHVPSKRNKKNVRVIFIRDKTRNLIPGIRFTWNARDTSRIMVPEVIIPLVPNRPRIRAGGSLVPR